MFGVNHTREGLCVFMSLCKLINRNLVQFPGIHQNHQLSWTQLSVSTRQWAARCVDWWMFGVYHFCGYLSVSKTVTPAFRMVALSSWKYGWSFCHCFFCACFQKLVMVIILNHWQLAEAQSSWYSAADISLCLSLFSLPPQPQAIE